MGQKAEVAEIVRAAETLEQSLRRLEELARSVQGARLNTDKNIARAGRTLTEAMEHHDQLALGLRQLSDAMVQMQQRQQAALELLAARANEIQRQHQLLAQHAERFAALGQTAADVSHLLQAEPGTLPDLAEVESRLLAISDEAKALVASADAADLSEVSKEASSLRQRIDSARGRLKVAPKDRPS
jgi:chromosome segregation ATPase